MVIIGSQNFNSNPYFSEVKKHSHLAFSKHLV